MSSPAPAARTQRTSSLPIDVLGVVVVHHYMQNHICDGILSSLTTDLECILPKQRSRPEVLDLPVLIPVREQVRNY